MSTNIALDEVQKEPSARKETAAAPPAERFCLALLADRGWACSHEEKPEFRRRSLQRPRGGQKGGLFDLFGQCFSESGIYHEKSEGHSRPLNHRKSDSSAAPDAQ